MLRSRGGVIPIRVTYVLTHPGYLCIDTWHIGLVNNVVPLVSFMDEAKEMAKSLAEKSPFVLKMVKYSINTGMMMDPQSSLQHSLRCVTMVINSEDMREGMRAFAEKRKPIWKGK